MKRSISMFAALVFTMGYIVPVLAQEVFKVGETGEFF